MKPSRTSGINVVTEITECQLNFHFQLPSVLLGKRRENFVNVYGAIISIVACRLSDRQYYVQVANVGYCVVIIFFIVL